MKRLTFVLVLTTGLVATFAISSCTKSAPLEIGESYQKLAIAPFSTEKQSADMELRFPLDLGTRLSLVKKDKEWIYDQSNTLMPIGSQLKAQGLTPKDIFLDPALAAKVGKAAGADLIVVGHISNPKLEAEKDDEPIYDMSNQAGISGTTRFVLVYEWATIKMQVKAIDTNTGEVIWDNGGFTGYTKYIREFQTQDPAADTSRISKEQMLADLRKHMISQIGHQIAPDVIEERPIPDILKKPERPLIRAGGKPIL